MYVYIETTFPWPYKNRDLVYQMSFHTINLSIVEIQIKAVPNFISPKKGIVRMQEAKGYMKLKTLKEKTEVTYVFHSDPGENIPAWLANNSISELPLRTLSGLKSILEKE